MKLESLVPPLEDCQKIPNGWFPDSALVWNIHEGKGEQWHVEPRKIRKPRYYDGYGRTSSSHADISAPTLAEIMAAFRPNVCYCKILGNQATVHLNSDEDYAIYGNEWECDENPAAAALRLLFKIKEA